MAKNISYDMIMFDKWLETRPACIQEMGKKYPPNLLYQHKETKQYVTLASYFEDGTVSMDVDPEFNKHRFEGMLNMGKHVFGVNPEELEVCDLPESFVDTLHEWEN